MRLHPFTHCTMREKALCIPTSCTPDPIYCVLHPGSCIPHLESCILHPMSCNPYPIHHVLHPASSNLYPASCTPYLASCIPHPIYCNPYPESCILHFAAYCLLHVLQRAPCILHPMSCIPHPAPHTLHPTWDLAEGGSVALPSTGKIRDVPVCFSNCMQLSPNKRCCCQCQGKDLVAELVVAERWALGKASHH